MVEPRRSHQAKTEGRALPAALWLMRMIAALLVAAQDLPAATYDGGGLAAVRYEQKIGAALPLDVLIHDSNGDGLPLRSYFGARPVVLLFGYTRCPQLCAVVATGAVETLRRVRGSVGRDYDVVYLSIDPTDTPRDLAALRQRDVRRYGRTGAEKGWHCVGADAATIVELTAAAGFHFRYDARTKLYAHPSGFVVLTPSGIVSQYFLGIDFDAKEIARALDRAAKGEVGASVFDLLLVCARGAGVTGRYGKIIWLTLEIAVALTVLALGWGIARMLRTERNRKVAAVVPTAAAHDRVADSDLTNGSQDDRRYLGGDA